MKFLLLSPFIFLQFWFLEAPLSLIRFFNSVNKSLANLLSLSDFIKTFFKPVKNEYRKGLILFSTIMGIVIKSFFIVIDIVILLFVLCIEAIVLISFILLPFATIGVLFI